MKLLFFILTLCIALLSANAMKIDSATAAKYAKDAYETKERFSEIYASANKQISTAKTHGVRYYILEEGEKTVIVIRGTDNMRNVLSDVLATDATFLDDEAIMVHEGFYGLSLEIFKTVKLNINKPVVLVGHSLGGAVSMLYGAMLYEKGLDVEVHTFGMPPIVNKGFLKKYKAMPHYRHFHIFDPLPSLSKPTVQFFQTQMKFKSFEDIKDTLSNVADTIKNVPDKYRHHGWSVAIKTKLEQLREALNDSLFFKTTTLYFDYHRVESYFKALSSDSSISQQIRENSYEELITTPNIIKETSSVKIIPSTLSGTVPLEVEFYVEDGNNDLELYYFNFAGKEVLLKELKNNKISYTFKEAGQNSVKVALKDKSGAIAETELVIATREATFKEFQEAFEKDFVNYLNK